ncbi:unnamed protein product [Rodentolepis nana]|uniref:Transmembrane 9 superfamily member n=1 Tax=Rodentolepis nana TaxID=102285 RepID=A0A0R3TV88_RODNA|nr:unnamed protein product [Rodentolepis nana]
MNKEQIFSVSCDVDAKLFNYWSKRNYGAFSLFCAVMKVSIVLLSILFRLSFCFYVPGLSPVEYDIGDEISVKAVKVWSSDTQLPIDFYKYLSFCDLKGKHSYENLNIGEVLRGDRLVGAPFKINMLKSVKCLSACKTIQLDAEKVNELIRLIANDYMVNLDVDDLPVAVERSIGGHSHLEIGYKVGAISDNEIYLNNHLKFSIKYHGLNNRYRVVGVTVVPMSINRESLSIQSDGTCEIKSDQRGPMVLKMDTPIQFPYTYEVEWVSSEIDWASRWDVYLNTGDGQIHWFSIINSIIVIIFLTAVMAVVLLKTLRRDIASYNREEDSEEIIEESGWKLVHGDVFRPPRRSALLAAFVGSGVQLLCMTFIVLSSRGALLSAVIFTYVFMGAVAGYFSGRIYKTMRGFYWKSTALLTGMLYPGIILSVCIFINFFLWAKGSTAAMPFTTILGILSLWLLVSLPLVFIGFFFGFRKRPFEQPVRTNQIPRAIPDRKMHQNIFVT